MTVCTGKPAKAFATISIGRELEWSMHHLEHTLSGLNCPMLAELPSKIENVAVVQQMINLIDNSKQCIGNADDKFIELFKERKLTLHGSLSKYIVTR